MPFDANTACSKCHRDMYAQTDIFNHSLHVEKLNGNAGCVNCHQDPAQPKNRETAVACIHCHQTMAAPGAFIAPPKDGTKGFAPGYMEAMHGLCISCHEKKLAQGLTDEGPGFAQCGNCHRDPELTDFQKQRPYPAD
jgi:hypothetical protein